MTCGNKHVMSPDQCWASLGRSGPLNIEKIKELWLCCPLGMLQWQSDIHQQVRRPHACTDSSSALSPAFCWWVLFFRWAVWFSWCIDHHFLLNIHRVCCVWLGQSCPYTEFQLGDILSYPSKQMPAKSNSGVLAIWKTVLSLPQFPYCYEIIDEEKPTHAGCSQKQRMLQALQSHLMHEMHHSLMKGHSFQMKKANLTSRRNLSFLECNSAHILYVFKS